MKVTAHCLVREQLRQLTEGEPSEAELATAEAHLSVCAACQTELDQAIASSAAWQIARESLSDAERPVSEDIEILRGDMLALLGPTDDPSNLGRIANYEIVGILGRGGMGVVFKGFDPPLNRYVAVKMLLPHLATSGAARKRFAREAQAAAAVVDDHVMAIHSVAEWQGVPYLVMPYTKGVSLHKRLAEHGPLELREILRIGMQAAKGLAAAHAQGLVHRDVKPANIMLGDEVERVALTDFGLARTVDDASVTRTGILAGTPQYMSPEQARGQPVDFRSDLFSLGSVLYAICTGRAPFRAETSYGVLRLITDDEPRPIQELNPDIPDWLVRLIRRLMAKQPEARFASAQETAVLLEACLAHVQQPSAAKLPPILTVTEESMAFAPTRRRIVVAGLLFACAVVCGWAAITFLPIDAGQPREGSEPAIEESLQGTWQLTASVDADGLVADEGHLKAVTYVIRASTLEFHNAVDNAPPARTRFAVGAPAANVAAHSPRTIEFLDYTAKGPDNQVRRMVGLWDCAADTLKICWSSAPPEKLGPALGVMYAELRRLSPPIQPSVEIEP